MKRLLIGITILVVPALTTAQSCHPDRELTRPNSRYEVVANGSEVKDKVTGLIWQRCSMGQSWDGNTCTGTATMHNWHDALTKASDVGNSYRIPNIKELQSLTETACKNPAINSIVFPNTQTSHYWSASPNAGGSHKIWTFDFIKGNTDYNYSYSSNHSYVRAVRTSQ